MDSENPEPVEVLRRYYLENERAKWWISIILIVLGIVVTILMKGGKDLLSVEAGMGYVQSVLLGVVSFIATEMLSLRHEARKEFLQLQEEAKRLLKTVPNSVKDSIADCDLDRPSTIKEGFAEIVRHLFDPTSPEIRGTIAAFMRESVHQILENGFVITNARFANYRKRSNEIVRNLYATQERNSMWTVCLYCPFQYLFMALHGALDMSSTGKPDHLLLFNGMEISSDVLKVNGTTDRMRIVYFPKERLHEVFGGSRVYEYEKNGMQIKSQSLDLAEEFVFAYIWFLLYNTKIDLYWRWRDKLRGDLTLEEDEDEEDFMVFNKTYFWRYNVLKETLFICWNWSKLGNHRKVTTGKMTDLFENAREAEPGFEKSLAALIRQRFRSGQVLDRFRSAVDSFLSKMMENRNWGSVQGYSQVYQSAGVIFLDKILAPLAEKVDTIPGYEEIETTVQESFDSLNQDEKLLLYKFFEDDAFGEAAKVMYPNLDNEVANYFVPGIRG